MSVRYGAGAMPTAAVRRWPDAGPDAQGRLSLRPGDHAGSRVREGDVWGDEACAQGSRDGLPRRGENSRVAERLTGEEYAAEQRRRIYSAFGSPHTTHLSCVDSEGLAVSITASMGYGSGLVVPGTGIPMNNTLGEPELNPRGFHALAPGSV